MLLPSSMYRNLEKAQQVLDIIDEFIKEVQFLSEKIQCAE